MKNSKLNSGLVILFAALGISLVLPLSVFSQQFGNALQFDGLDDYVMIGNETSLQVDHFTLTAWAHPYSYSDPIPEEQRMEIFEKAGEYWMNISTNGGWKRDKGEVRVGGIFEGQWHFLDSDYVVPLNEWTHVACTYDSDSLVLYINGKYNVAKAIAENHTDKNETDNMLAIGCKSINGISEDIEAQFHGMLDELSIWNITMEQSDIEEIMKNGIGANHPMYKELRAYYKMDENRIGENTGTVNDETGMHEGDNYGAYWLTNQFTTTVSNNLLMNRVSIYPSYPNPFHNVTTIPVVLEKAAFVNIDIYNRMGQHVQNIMKSELHQGKHFVEWDASGKPEGIYFCRIKAGAYNNTIKCILIK